MFARLGIQVPQPIFLDHQQHFGGDLIERGYRQVCNALRVVDSGLHAHFESQSRFRPFLGRTIAAFVPPPVTAGT